MQVFKTFFKIVRHYLGSICVYFIIFATIFLCMALLVKTNDTLNFAAKKSNIAVIDRDNTTYSKDLTSYLGSIHNLVSIKDDTNEMQNELYFRNVVYIVIIPKGYEDQIMNKKFDHLLQNVKVPNSFSGTYIDNQINQYLKTLKIYTEAGYKQADALTATSSILSSSIKVTMISAKTNTPTDGILAFFQYFIYVILGSVMVGLGPILIRFSDPNLSARMNASALSLKKRNLSLILSSLLFVFVCWAAFIGLGLAVFKNTLFSTLGLLCIINSLLFTLIAISLTFLTCTFVHNVNAIGIVSNTLGLGMCFLCGVFVPASIMSPGVVNASKILPAYWYINAHNRFLNYVQTSNGLATILIDFVIEAGFCIVFLFIGLIASHIKQTH